MKDLEYVKSLCELVTPAVGVALAKRALPHGDPNAIVSGEPLFDDVPDLVTLKITTNSGEAAPRIPAEWVEQELRNAGVPLPERPAPVAREGTGCCSTEQTP